MSLNGKHCGEPIGTQQKLARRSNISKMQETLPPPCFSPVYRHAHGHTDTTEIDIHNTGGMRQRQKEKECAIERARDLLLCLLCLSVPTTTTNPRTRVCLRQEIGANARPTNKRSTSNSSSDQHHSTSRKSLFYARITKVTIRWLDDVDRVAYAMQHKTRFVIACTHFLAHGTISIRNCQSWTCARAKVSV